MRRPPPLTRIPSFPVSAGIGLLAAAVTLAFFGGASIDRFTMSPLAFRGEPWRLLTSALPHGDVLHLAFNLYWLWVFGTALEERFGHARTLLLMAFFAAVSAAAEYAVFTGGIGLSGVGYGLFGMLWMLSPRDPRFRDAVDARTVQLFLLWGALCIVTTAFGLFSVANVAHGMGLALGVLVGRAAGQRERRALWLALAAALVVGTGAAATVGRPWVSATRKSADAPGYLGYVALDEGRTDEAIALYEQAVRLDDQRGALWFNLGIAYQRRERLDQARDAYRRACAAGEPGGCDALRQ